MGDACAVGRAPCACANPRVRRVVLSVPCEPAALMFSSSLCWCLVIFLSENEVVLCAYLTNVTSLEAAGFSSGVSFLFVFVSFR